MRRSPTPKYVPALGFDWLTPYYDAVVRATTRERHFKHALIRHASFEPGQRVLDLACGTGTLAIWIKQYQPQADVTGGRWGPRYCVHCFSQGKCAQHFGQV